MEAPQRDIEFVRAPSNSGANPCADLTLPFPRVRRSDALRKERADA